jgi:cupin superfamily acireductone dioxygenase involved in methionine salvage
LLCELGNGYAIPADADVIAYTQEQFNEMCEEFYKEHGHYPDE